MGDRLKVSGILRAIRRQARRIKHKRSHFTVNEHVDAILKLAYIGSDIIRASNERKREYVR